LPHWDVILQAAKEVGLPFLVFAGHYGIIRSHFTLEAQEGRLFKPLAFTKTYSMGAAAILAITLVPVLMGLFIRGKIKPERSNPVNRLLMSVYHRL